MLRIHRGTLLKAALLKAALLPAAVLSATALMAAGGSQAALASPAGANTGATTGVTSGAHAAHAHADQQVINRRILTPRHLLRSGGHLANVGQFILFQDHRRAGLGFGRTAPCYPDSPSWQPSRCPLVAYGNAVASRVSG